MTHDKALESFSGSVCLVTGGAGAIGSNLTKALLKSGAKVTVLDNFSSGFLSNVETDLGLPSIIDGDVNSEEDLRVAFQCKPDFVFHLAAHFANQNSVNHPLDDCIINVNGTLRVLEHCRRSKGLRRLLYASSSCVLGHCSGTMTENSPVAAATPYAVSKLAGEQYTLMYNSLFEVPTTVVRYFNVYGPGERPGKYRNVVPNFIQHALSGRALIVTGTGAETREFVFVDDAIRATLLAAASPQAMGQLFHVGSGAVLTIRDVAERIRALTGGVAVIKYASRRNWDGIVHRSTTFEKARQAFGYEPRVSFNEGLDRTIAWICKLQQPGLFPATTKNYPVTDFV